MLKDVLRERRKALRLKQSEVAEKIGVKSQTYMKWENGIYEPKVSYISKLAKVLKVTEKEICNGELIEKNIYDVLEFIEIIEKMEKAFGKTKLNAILYEHIDDKYELIRHLEHLYESKREEVINSGVPGNYPDLGVVVFNSTEEPPESE
ncbi:helix-turn-helix transcriptional regulator [Salmonella enterica]|nr:helix-turn-helix transcriptional regulator [Salmonella enterica]